MAVAFYNWSIEWAFKEGNPMPDAKGASQRPFEDRIAILSGASKGIGKETAKEFAALGASVCLIARHKKPLQDVAAEIEDLMLGDEQFVESIECDTTDNEKLSLELTEFIDRRRVPDYLVNLVGFAYPKYAEELKYEDYRQAMEVNYFGQLNPILIMLPHFIAARRGHIANVSSAMGLTGIVGYAAYAPSKFAIVGLTEVLRHELKPYGIRLSILFPPDTDTPGFEFENRTKPRETAKLSEAGKLMSPTAVGQAFVAGIRRNQYFILPGEVTTIWRVNRLFPWFVRWLTDRQYRQIRTELGKE